MNAIYMSIYIYMILAVNSCYSEIPYSVLAGTI